MADNFKLPGSSYEEIIKIIKAYSSGKEGQAQPLDAIAQASGIDRTIVSRNNGFLLQMQLLMEGAKEPDIILMDINLKNISSEDGLELAKQILSCYPEQRVVILSGYDLPVYRSEARKIGAKGFVNKNIEPEKLISILSKIMQGRLYFDREIPFIEGLTDSEKQIIQLIAEGQKRKDIASTLYISERTLSNHLQHIFEKLDVTSAVEAVTKAIQLGYIPPIC